MGQETPDFRTGHSLRNERLYSNRRTKLARLALFAEPDRRVSTSQRNDLAGPEEEFDTIGALAPVFFDIDERNIPHRITLRGVPHGRPVAKIECAAPPIDGDRQNRSEC